MKYYFDTSSLVKIYHPEDGSKTAIELYKSAERIFISELSKIEFLSTIYRKFRENEINSETLNALAARFQGDIETRYELLEFSSLVFEESSRLVCDFAQKYSLKTLDSLQFAFFTTYCEEDDIFVCSDKKLTSIVELEGVTVFVPTGYIPTEKGRRQVGKTSQYRIFLSPPHMGGEEMHFIKEAFKSNYIAPLGPQVDAFEKELTEYVGVKGALALSSGTAAIHLALRFLNVSRGDTVFCPSLTFIGSANPILYQGATPVFIDAEPETWNMSPAALKRAFMDAEKSVKLPKAVIVVNLYGQSADMTPLLAVCDHYGVPVIEDAAESLGATYKGKASGTFGTFGVYSFNGNKIITTSGGGMLVSDDMEALEKARFWSTQARDPAPHYQHSEMGYNYRMSNLLAAVGRGQLRVLDSHVKACRDIFRQYHQALSDIEGFDFMPEVSYGRSNQWLTVLTVDPKRCCVTSNEIIDALDQQNIEARPVWKPMHIQPLFNPLINGRKKAQKSQKKDPGITAQRKCAYYPHGIGESVCEGLFEKGLCLPSGTAMTEGDLDRVIEVIRKVRSRKSPR